MPDLSIICPNPKCEWRIPITGAIADKLAEDILKIERESRKKAEAETAKRVEALQKQLEEAHQGKKNILEDYKQKFSDYDKKQQEILKAEKARLESEARKKVEAETGEKIGAMTRQIDQYREKEKKSQEDFAKRIKQLHEEQLKQLSDERVRIEKEAKAKAEKEVTKRMESLEKQLKDANFREKEVRADYEDRIDEIREKHLKQLSDARAKIEKEAKEKAKEEVTKQMEDLKRQTNEAQQREKKTREELEKRIIQVRQEQQEKMTREKERIERDAKKKAQEEFANKYYIRDLEHEKEIRGLRDEINKLKLIVDKTTPFVKGEAVELEVEKLLKKDFPNDEIIPVRRGKLGADIIQKIRSSNGDLCGTIVWETKNTERWGNAWITKLKNDQRREKAECAVLVSKIFPKDRPDFFNSEGVWVTNYALVPGVALALRSNIVEIANLRQTAQSKTELKVLFDYITGTQFRQRVEAIVDIYRDMQEDLVKEREAAERRWAKREKQNQLFMQNIQGMYIDMQNIVGKMLPTPKKLELLPAPRN